MKTALWISLLAFARPVFAQDPNQGGTAAAIRALEHQWIVGQSHNDNRALDLIFDNSLIYIEYGNLVTKGDYLARIKTEKPSLDQIVVESMTVHLFPKAAIVVGIYVEKQTLDRKQIVRHWRFIDTWVYKKNGWVLVSAGSSPVSR
jgi:hypothetical protein